MIGVAVVCKSTNSPFSKSTPVGTSVYRRTPLGIAGTLRSTNCRFGKPTRSFVHLQTHNHRRLLRQYPALNSLTSSSGHIPSRWPSHRSWRLHGRIHDTPWGLGTIKSLSESQLIVLCPQHTPEVHLGAFESHWLLLMSTGAPRQSVGLCR